MINWVCVVYGHPEQVKALYASLDVIELRHRFVVCCNKPGDFNKLESWAADRAGTVVLLDFPDNPGYLPAFHRAQLMLGLQGCIVLSNSDLLAKSSVLEQLENSVKYLDRDVMAIAPAVIGAGGSDQNPHLMSPPSRRKLRVLAALHRWPVVADLLLLRRRGHSARSYPSSGRSVMWSGHGSCVIFLATFFAQGGDTDYPQRLFGEELWIGREVARLGGTVSYDPAIVLRHAEHGSTGTRRRGHVAAEKYASLRYWSNQPFT